MKTYDEIFLEVQNLIAYNLNLPLSAVEPHSNIGDLATDSIKLFELLTAFESFYEMEFAYQDIADVDTPQDATHYIARVKYNQSK